MTIRNRFILIAVSIVLPSALAVAGYFYFAQGYSSDPKEIALNADTRRWAALVLSGEAGKPNALSREIAAIAVLRGDGVVVFSNAKETANGESSSPGRLFDRISSSYPGADCIAESILGEPGGSYVAAIIPAKEPWYLDPYIIGTVIILMLECLVVSIGIVLMLRTSSSILALSDAARRIARGDLAFSLEEKGDDEVTMLYRAFDGMRQELSEAQDGRSRFLMGVSHDLRTPLTSIKGYLQALKEGLAKDPSMRDRFMSILWTKAELLESRIQELIEFAGLETAVWRANLEDVKLKDFLEEIARAAASDAEVHGRKFSSSIRVDRESTVKADPRLFLRVLENLLSNAMRYTRPGDAIALEAGESDTLVSIVVRDDGPGIPQEDRKRIFDAFYRGTRARNEEGLGLGLSIVKSVVSAHGWKVRLEEDAGAGASFVISIPKPPAP
jgi:signal transduction histidine kinase